MKRAWFVTLLVAGLLVAGLLTARNNATKDDSPHTEYKTAQVTRGDLISAVSATGTLKAVLQVKVGSQLSGQIAELFVDFNDVVTAGQPIAQLDSRSYEAKMREGLATLKVSQAKVSLQEAAIAVVEEGIASAEARHEEARRTLSRREALQKKGTISEAMLDEAQAEFDSAAALLRAQKAQLRVKQAELNDARALVERQEALLAQAQIELSRTVIQAPIDGVIVGRGVEEGQTVAASLEAPTLFEIAQDLSNMEIHVRVDEADIGLVQVGQPINFSVDAYPGRSFAGAVTQIRKSPEVIENVVTYTVVCSAANPELVLLPGMTASVRIVVMEIPDVIRVPNAALRFRPPQPSLLASVAEEDSVQQEDGLQPDRDASVWVPDRSGEPSPVRIRVGQSDGSASELLSGALQSGDHVIVGKAAKPEKDRSILGFRLGF